MPATVVTEPILGQGEERGGSDANRIATDEGRGPGPKAARRFAVARRRPPATSDGLSGQPARSAPPSLPAAFSGRSRPLRALNADPRLHRPLRLGYRASMRRTGTALLPLVLLAGCAGYAADYWKPKNSLIAPQLPRY